MLNTEIVQRRVRLTWIPGPARQRLTVTAFQSHRGAGCLSPGRLRATGAIGATCLGSMTNSGHAGFARASCFAADRPRVGGGGAPLTNTITGLPSHA